MGVRARRAGGASRRGRGNRVDAGVSQRPVRKAAVLVFEHGAQADPPGARRLQHTGRQPGTQPQVTGVAAPEHLGDEHGRIGRCVGGAPGGEAVVGPLATRGEVEFAVGAAVLAADKGLETSVAPQAVRRAGGHGRGQAKIGQIARERVVQPQPGAPIGRQRHGQGECGSPGRGRMWDQRPGRGGEKNGRRVHGCVFSQGPPPRARDARHRQAPVHLFDDCCEHLLVRERAGLGPGLQRGRSAGTLPAAFPGLVRQWPRMRVRADMVKWDGCVRPVTRSS